MMQVFNSEKYFFTCLEEDAPTLGDLKSYLKEPLHKNNLVVWTIDSSTIDLLNNFKIPNGYRLMNYLDYFYLVVPINSPAKHKQLFNNFFRFLGPMYESFIDVDRNKENIENLMMILENHFFIKDSAKVLDYGCGTGISLDIAHNHKANIIGFDPCDVMCHIATKRGMEVWDVFEMEKQPCSSIDAAFSSYVFHLLEENEYLDVLSNILKPQGVLVVNFHKNQGRKWADKYFTQRGFKIFVPSSFKSFECHGPYVAYIKSK